MEFRSDEKGFEGAWFEGTITTLSRGGDPCRIQLDKFINDNGEPLLEEMQPDKMRPVPPQRQLVVPLEKGLFIEVYDKDCWWHGFVVRRLFYGEEFWLVYFPATKTLCAHCLSAFRHVQDWKDGTWHWIFKAVGQQKGQQCVIGSGLTGSHDITVECFGFARLHIVLAKAAPRKLLVGGGHFSSIVGRYINPRAAIFSPDLAYKLVYRGLFRMDADLILSDTELDGSDLTRIKPPQVARSGFQILLKTPKGNTTVIWTYDSDRVSDLKNNIADQNGYPSAEQHLLNEGRSLQECRTMQEYNIKLGSTITLNMRLRGRAENAGTSSQSKGSFKEVVKGKGKNPTAITEPPGQYIVDQMPESPSISIEIPEVNNIYSNSQKKCSYL